MTSNISSSVIPHPGELPDAKRDAPRAFEVLKKGGVIIAPADVRYGMMATSTDAIERIFIAKKRKAGHSMGVVGTYNLLTRLYDLPELIPNVERVVKNGTLGFAIGEGPFSRDLARLNDENGLVMVGSSANLTDQGQKFRVEDIESEIVEAADLIVNNGRQKWHLHGRAGTILDMNNERVSRIGANYENIREKLIDLFGWSVPNDPDYDMTGKKTVGFSIKGSSEN
ncbi:hypothetical protein FMUND_11855 [Fusarium mundagurra]|uniref:Threonylcarbamoyl-AMP synthase n=1 Tax=Fusarium mundagurra TaxID=1567541 RepID=A0A8H5Y578_9HYPO|nr:hypothetical protein FMUND_11855 [Fusarium mundagurra]